MNNFLRLCAIPRCPRIARFSTVNNVSEFENRHLFEDTFPNTSTEEIKHLWKIRPQCVYAGFDPTAESLHIGNLLVLTNLLHWQRCGHQVIALLGGATGLIGDPSHRKAERVEMERFLIEENVKSIENDIKNVFRNHEQFLWKQQRQLRPIMIVNNLDWYKDVNVISFIRDVGKHFRMGTMLGRSCVQSRLKSDTGMSFTEFCYSVFQAYDWVHLHKNYKCNFQIGGHDQMGNIVAGYDLVAKYSKEKVYGMTLPLFTAEGGIKFGKSTGNAVWLSPSKSSSFQLYQFFIRARDSDVEKFLKFFTFLPLESINEIVEDHAKYPEKRRAQKVLAEQITLLVHGVDGLHAAKKTSAALYDNSVESLSKLKVDDLRQIFEGATITELFSEPGITIHDLAMKAKCFETERDARRIITAGGFYVNHQKITNTEELVVPGIHILSNNLTLLRVGKKTYHIVRWG